MTWLEVQPAFRRRSSAYLQASRCCSARRQWPPWLQLRELVVDLHQLVELQQLVVDLSLLQKQLLLALAQQQLVADLSLLQKQLLLALVQQQLVVGLMRQPTFAPVGWEVVLSLLLLLLHL